jgi:hypothetical protein
MKVKLGAINDRHEREADSIAEQVMLPFQAASGMLQRHDAPLHHSGSLPPPHRVDGDRALVNGAGRALAKETQADMQQRFGMDLGHVRIHTDAAAAHSAQALNAMAYTVGRDIVFAPNQYAPDTDRGRRLLAHELAHVVQQADGTVTCGGDAGVVVQRAAQAAAPAGAAAVLGWCLSGAGISVLLDEAFQVGGWLLQGSDRGEFQQNWCRTIIAALLGCATGMAGGALRTMLAELGVASGLTLGALLRWLMAQGIRLPAHIVSFLGRQGCLEEELPANAGS